MSRSGPPRPARAIRSDAGDGARPIAELVRELAEEVGLLRYDHHNPGALLERRDFCRHRLNRLAQRLEDEGEAEHVSLGFLSEAEIEIRRSRRVKRQVREVVFRRTA